MNLYRVNPSSSFLDIVADFILDNFAKESISNLKIILPSGFACLNLQNILIKKQNIAILPNIIPFSNIMAEGEEIFGITSENLEPITLEPITFLQERIILAEIIHNYPKLQFSITQSLQFCSTIAELFYQLACNNLSIDSVNEIEKMNPSKHWNVIYEFLKYTHHQWKKQIELFGLLDRVNYQITMMEAEIARLKRADTNLIVAGIIGHNLISWNFLKNIANSPCGFIILPPISNRPLLEYDKHEEDCLYSLKKLLTTLNKDLSDFQPLGNEQQHHSILDQIIFEDIVNSGELDSRYDGAKPIDNRRVIEDDVTKFSSIDYKDLKTSESIDCIKYFELEDIFQEAEQISLICKQYSDKKIAIIVNNQTSKSFYCNFLTKYSLEFQDLLGDNLTKTLVSSLIISVSEILCNDFDIKKLFLLLKNPFINCKLVPKLELLMSGKNRFIRQPSQMLSLVEKTNDDALIKWCKKLIDLLYTNSGSSFVKILKSSIKIAEKLYPNIWYEQPATELSTFLSSLIKDNCDLTLSNKKCFPELLKSLMFSCKYFAHNNYSKNIIIGKAEDLMLLKFDLVILSDFNQGSLASSSAVNQWINEQTLKKLHIATGSTIHQYYFYLFLHNAQVIITRAKRQDGKSGLLPSNLLLKLQFILQKSLISENYLTYLSESDLVDVPNNRYLSKLACAEEFEGVTERKTAAYLSVREDLSTGTTYKLPAEVEFQKISNVNMVESIIANPTNISSSLRGATLVATKQSREVNRNGLLRSGFAPQLLKVKKSSISEETVGRRSNPYDKLHGLPRSRTFARNDDLSLTTVLSNDGFLTFNNYGFVPPRNDVKNTNWVSHNHSGYVYSPIFPEVISVTDIEMLVRNPYSFYAKKILNLRSKDMIGQEPKISEFGSFVHKVLEQYSKNYDKLENNKIGLILEISNNVLQNTILPTYTQKIWQIKFIPIAESFIEFDEKRRSDFQYIYSECRGEISLNIGGQELTIIGVADRIEVDELGAAVIIDYKTGSLPSKKDVEAGLSPQLIIGGLMLQEGGFAIKVHSVKQVTYVKISSSKPIIQTLEIDLTKEDLERHKQGMMRVLEYYVTNKNFPYDIDLLKYDDYAHLARRDL
ncbi:PD-(D/E)XK nuclease family protein [Candidatus Tisiphia endosymbiont of Myopa tessellatipennis]|uniref:PD-(D/E)XK nuclease family protein n=1 Tax=Candidatus Tisiphia endosymbiont of Myopa tessellatipennis TaxID=3066257 RepID=UPI00313F3866